MQNRLQLCSVYLKEIEGKLLRLQDSLGDNLEAKSKVIEALGFIEQAQRAVSQTPQRVDELEHARTHLVKVQSA